MYLVFSDSHLESRTKRQPNRLARKRKLMVVGVVRVAHANHDLESVPRTGIVVRERKCRVAFNSTARFELRTLD